MTRWSAFCQPGFLTLTPLPGALLVASFSHSLPGLGQARGIVPRPATAPRGGDHRRRHDPRLGSVSRASGRFDNAACSCRGGRQRPRHSTGRPPRRRRWTRRAPWPPPARWRTDPARGGGGGSPIPPTRQGCGRRPGRRQSRLQAPHPPFHRYHRPVRWIQAKNSGENGRLRTPVRRAIIRVIAHLLPAETAPKSRLRRQAHDHLRRPADRPP